MSSGNNSFAAAAAAGPGSGRDLFNLLSELCTQITGKKPSHYEELSFVLEFLAKCPDSIDSQLPVDELSLITRISRELDTVHNDTQHSDKFKSFHYELCVNHMDAKLRQSILGFFMFLMKKNLTEKGMESNTHDCFAASMPSSKGPTIKNVSIKDELSHKSKTTNATTTRSLFNLMSNINNDNNLNNNLASETNSDTLSNFRSVAISNTNGSQCFRAYNPYVSVSGDTKINFESVPNYLDELRADATYDLNNDMLQQVIYALAGIENSFIKKDHITRRFKVDVKDKNVHKLDERWLKFISELCFYHSSLIEFSQAAGGQTVLGRMGHGFLAQVKVELTRYYGSIAQLQDQLTKQQKAHRLNRQKVYPPPDGLTLYKIGIWCEEPLMRMQHLVKIADACKTKKGGELASAIFQFQSVGCLKLQSLTRSLLKATCNPLLQMIVSWLIQGDLTDHGGEFFIECINEVGDERLWHDKYRLRQKMLPTFISDTTAKKILVTGKSINFLREICKDLQPLKGRDDLRHCVEANPEQIFAYAPDRKLHSIIDAIYQCTSKRVLDIIVGPHKLLEHLQSMRRYLLLGQGDFIGILMENMQNKLDKPAAQVNTQELSTIMEAALRCTTTASDDFEVLNHLDISVESPFRNETGWDIISLQYTVRGPLATMLEPSKTVYQSLFKPLWRMKHMEFVLSNKIWRDQKCNAKLLRSMNKDLNKVSYRLNLITSESTHFVYQMQYYTLFEVIECNWVEFQKRIQTATTLDDILTAHSDFLNTITRGIFVDGNGSNISLFMEHVYENIKRLEVWQERFYALCFKELESRNEYQNRIKASEETGEFGVTIEQKLERDQEHKIFEQTLAAYDKSLEHIGSEFEKSMRGFLLALNSSEDHNLKLFGIRLDFNDYYKKRDLRLNVPFTFEHMRMSMNVFGSINKGMLSSRTSCIN